MKTRTVQSPTRSARASRIRTPPVSKKAFAQLLRTPKRRPQKHGERSPQTPEIPQVTRQPQTRRPVEVEPRRAREHRVEPDTREPTPLEPFTPLPSVLATSQPSAPDAAVGASWDRAQVAAMAERMLTSFRRGEVDGREEVRMQLRILDAEVRVRVDEGRVMATLVGEGLEGLATTLERELRSRGLDSEITLSSD